MTKIKRFIKSVRYILSAALSLSLLFSCAFAAGQATADAGLAALSISCGQLAPAFSPEVYDYTVGCDGIVQSAVVTAVAEDSLDSVTVNGVDYAEGRSVLIAYPETDIGITVSSPDGDLQSYTIRVEVAASQATGLSNLYVDPGSLSPAFSPDTTAYSLSVSGDLEKAVLTPVVSDSSQSITINVEPVANGGAFALTLDNGANTAVISVCSTGSSSKTYVVTVTREEATAGLANLSVSPGELSPAFSSAVTSYSVAAPDTAQVTLTPTALDASQSVAVNGTPVTSGQQFALPLVNGASTAVITVSAAGGASKTYVVTVMQSADSGAGGLTGLTVSPGTLSPSFSPETLCYSVSVPGSASAVTLTPTAEALITVNGSSVSSGAGFSLPLSFGSNTAVIDTNLDGTTISYVVTVTRPSSQSGLSELDLSEGSLSPYFSPEVTSYSAKVDNSVTRIYVSAVPADSTAKVKVNDSTSGSVPLLVGPNSVVITVTGSDGNVTAYTVDVFRKYDATVTISSADADGVYRAPIPDYADQMDDTDAFTFLLGDDEVVIPASALKYLASGAVLTLGDAPQATLSSAAEASPAVTVAGGVNLSLSGSGTLDAKVTLKLSSAEKSALKTGTPGVYSYATGSLEPLDAVVDLSASTASFTAQSAGTYILASSGGVTGDYAVTADRTYTPAGNELMFYVKVTEDPGLPQNSAKLMVVTTLSDGSQKVGYYNVTGDGTNIPVSVDGRAASSSVYLIDGSLNGSKIPPTYALTQFVKK